MKPMERLVMDPRPFLENRQTLQYPELSAIQDVFSRLPKKASIEIVCGWKKRLDVLRTLEACGGFAIGVDPVPGFEEVRIRALKGKAGACYDTGRTATCLGSALAVMDDDRHLILGTIRICEKTGGFYTLPPYEGLLSVSEPDPDMLARLDTNPIVFDCDTFDRDAARLSNHPFDGGSKDIPSTPVLYTGPFKLIILRDGIILRRGICTKISASLVDDLVKKDRVVILPDKRAEETAEPLSYSVAYAAIGAGCLVDELVTQVQGGASLKGSGSAQTEDLSLRASQILKISSPETRQRLAHMIEREEPYFILVGSDPKDTMGCCPSTQVGEANYLVEVGVLASHRIPGPPDACSTSIYAFAGELTMTQKGPQFSLNAPLRRRILEEIE